MTLKTFILGLLVSFGTPWLLIIVVPSLTMNNIDPVVAQGLLTFVSAAMSYVGLSIVFSGQLPLLRISIGPPLGPHRSDR